MASSLGEGGTGGRTRVAMIKEEKGIGLID